MSEEYKEIPATEAARLSAQYAKDAVLIVAIDDAHNRFHFTTHGTDAEAKLRAARLLEEFSKFLGCDQASVVVTEDFREEKQAAVIKEQRDKMLAALKEVQQFLAQDVPDGSGESSLEVRLAFIGGCRTAQVVREAIAAAEKSA